MSSLRQFIAIPKDLREWNKWQREALTAETATSASVTAGDAAVTAAFTAADAAHVAASDPHPGYTTAAELSAAIAAFAAAGIFTAPVRLKGYTVGTLPAGTIGDTAYVTDATAPTYLGALTGGGAVVCPVFHNGVSWVSG